METLKGVGVASIRVIVIICAMFLGCNNLLATDKVSISAFCQQADSGLQASDWGQTGRSDHRIDLIAEDAGLCSSID